MNTTKIFKLLLVVAVVLFVASAGFYLADISSYAGISLVAGFIFLAFGVRGYPKVKGFSYTMWIFAAVTLSMIYPQLFLSVGDFKLSLLIVPLLQIIMFGMGSQMSLNDFTGVIKMPKGVLIGVGAHYLIMPLVGFAIANLFDFSPEIKAGIILIGCVPSGLASNVMSFIAGANLALAVTIGAISTLLAPFVTPFLMKILGGHYVEVNFWKMMLEILNMIILPIVAGFIFNLFSKGERKLKSTVFQLLAYFVIILLTNLVYLKYSHTDAAGFAIALLKSLAWFFFLPMIGAIAFKYFLKNKEDLLPKILSFISMAGIAVIITIITAAGRENLLQVGALLIITSLLHNLAGYSFGYSVSWLFGMPEADRRTIAFEVGMQNGGLASGLASEMGKLATVGLAPAIFGPLMNITGSSLATWWKGKPVTKNKKDK
jgi:BASS family bile acid:Na+ symporter